METPSSSTRSVTRSQTLAATSNSIPVSRKIEDSEKKLSKSKGQQQQQDRCALMDLTNDSPIVGLANGGNMETPLVKQRRSQVKNTPGSGEALLRGQVKTLMQKVEEDALELLAPTPQIHSLSGGGTTGLASITPSVILQQQSIHQVVNHMFDGKNQESCESEKSVITRSLLLDFSEKSQVSDASEECSSELSYQEVVQKPLITSEDDDASIWSMQVNASTHDEDEEEEEIEKIAENEEDYFDEEEEEYEEGGLLLDELCEGLNNICVNERIAPKFAGKHTRFVYNSDDELVKEEEDGEENFKHTRFVYNSDDELVKEEEDEEENFAQSVSASSPNILHLKGLPTPKGKHLRFSEEEEEEEGKSTL